MMIKWFDATAAKTFGQEMAELINHRTPASVETKNQEKLKKKNDKRHEASLALIEKRLAKFKQVQVLNVYTKAQLGSAFKYALIDFGYDQEFSDQTTTWLLLRCK